MIQPFAHRPLYLRDRSVKDLVHILRGNDLGGRRKVLLDVDGSIHQGMYESKLRGITNADLAFYLCSWMPVTYVPEFLQRNIAIYSYDRITLAQGISKREKHTRHLVDSFLSALEPVDTQLIEKGAQWLTRFAYPHVKETLADIPGSRVLISCGLQPVIDAYGRYLGTRYCFGNSLDSSQRGRIYGAKDKERIVEDVCSYMNPSIGFGDTADDLGIARGMKRRNEESVFVALHGRSRELEEDADIICPSWKDLRALLDEY